MKLNQRFIWTFIKDGNLRTSWQFILGVVGIFLLLLPAFVSMPYYLKIIFFSFGALFGGVGGYSAKASVLRLRPFDNSYKKARESYVSQDNVPKPTDEKG